MRCYTGFILARRRVYDDFYMSLSPSLLADQFVDSHPILTRRKIMSDRRLMVSECRRLRATLLCSNDPLAAIHVEQVDFARGYQRIESTGSISSRLLVFDAVRLASAL